MSQAHWQVHVLQVPAPQMEVRASALRFSGATWASSAGLEHPGRRLVEMIEIASFVPFQVVWSARKEGGIMSDFGKDQMALG